MNQTCQQHEGVCECIVGYKYTNIDIGCEKDFGEYVVFGLIAQLNNNGIALIRIAEKVKMCFVLVAKVFMTIVEKERTIIDKSISQECKMYTHSKKLSTPYQNLQFFAL